MVPKAFSPFLRNACVFLLFHHRQECHLCNFFLLFYYIDLQLIGICNPDGSSIRIFNPKKALQMLILNAAGLQIRPSCCARLCKSARAARLSRMLRCQRNKQNSSLFLWHSLLFSIFPSSFPIFHPSSFILHFSSFISHLSSFIFHLFLDFALFL